MKAKLLRLVWGLALMLLPGLAFAQQGTVEGTITDPQGQPLPGANVALQGTTYGSASGVDGRFRFTAPAGSYTLAVSYVSYADYTAPLILTANETVRLSIQLQEGSIDLDEVVVTALGIEREERSLGYAHQEVDGDLLRRANESNLVNALAGKLAGVEIISSSGQPGKAARIVIRGNSSLLYENQPLFVVDGIPVSNDEDDNPQSIGTLTGGTFNRALDLDPNIVADVQLLKGAAAAALYGSRAANGVVLITTKGGLASGRPQVTFSSTARWDDAIIGGFQNRFTQGTNGCFTDGLNEVAEDCYPGGLMSLSWGPSVDSVNANADLLQALGVSQLPVHDPRREFYQTGGAYENNVNVSGGALGGNYFLSGSLLNQDGVTPGTGLGRASLMAKYSTNLSRKLDATTSINYVNTSNTWLAEGNTQDAYVFGLNIAPISFDLSDSEFEDGTQRSYTSGYNNPYWVSGNNSFGSNVDRFMGSMHLSYDLLPWLTVSNRAGLDAYGDERKGQTEIGTFGLYDGGAVFSQKISRREINNDLILQAERDFGPSWGLTALLGHNVNRQYYNWTYQDGRGLTVPGFFNLSNASTVTGSEHTSERMLLGVYSQATLDYDDWAYLTLTGRNDWSSTLPAENNSYFYPSASLGLVFTEPIGFFEKTPLSFGKLRASVSQVGNDAPVYSTRMGYKQAAPGDGERGFINIPFNGVNGFELDNVLFSPDLQPEITTEYELGLDLRFFGQRARLDAAYYNSASSNQIFNVPVSPATGFVRYLQNAGSIRNSGVELMLGVTPIQTRNFAWDVTANFSKNHTEVVELAPNVEDLRLFGLSFPYISVRPGSEGYGTIMGYGNRRADPVADAALFEENPELEEGMLLIGATGRPLSSSGMVPIGNIQPDWLGNLRSSVTYKGLALSALVDVRRGGDVMNFDLWYTIGAGTAEMTEDRGATTVYEGFNVSTGEMNTVEVTKDQTFYRNYYRNIDENLVEDGSYVKLREISLAYSLPSRLMRSWGVQDLTLTATGRNLWIKSDFSYVDPEGSLAGSGNGQGFYHFLTPNTRGYSLGVRLTL